MVLVYGFGVRKNVQSWFWVLESATCFQAWHAACANIPRGQKDCLPFLIPPYQWLSWWLLTRSFLFGPFLPPRHARRLQEGHGKASLPQRRGCYNCSLQVCKPRCPSEAKPWRSNGARNSHFFRFSFLAVSSEKSRSGREIYEWKVEHVFSTPRICRWEASSECL